MDIALTLEALVPGAKYGGSLTANNRAAYDALRWEDGRPKPSWNEIESAAVSEQQARSVGMSDVLAAMDQIAKAANITGAGRSKLDAIMGKLK